MLLKSLLLVIWWMMRLWWAETRRGVGEEHCRADSGGGEAARAAAAWEPPSDHSWGDTITLLFEQMLVYKMRLYFVISLENVEEVRFGRNLPSRLDFMRSHGYDTAIFSSNCWCPRYGFKKLKPVLLLLL